MNAVLKIWPDLMAELDNLAVETHRSESDILNEALESSGACPKADRRRSHCRDQSDSPQIHP